MKIISLLETINLDHTIIACTRDGAVIKDTIADEEAAIVKGSYAQVRQVHDLNEREKDFKIILPVPMKRMRS